MKSDTFYLYFPDNYFKRGEILVSNNILIKILETPHKKWYKQLFQIITFGLYKVPTEYKCKII